MTPDAAARRAGQEIQIGEPHAGKIASDTTRLVAYGVWHRYAKVTFTVDDETVRTLRTTAERLGKPQSLIIREAIADYAARAGRLTEAERRRLLKTVDTMMCQPPTRPQGQVTRELRDIRRARGKTGRRHAAE